MRVKRRGVDVRARKGYWAATVDDAVRATAPAPEAPRPIQKALASISTSVQAGKYVRTWIGTERAENGKTRVTLVWEPLPQLPGVRRDPAGPRLAACCGRQGRPRVPRPFARCRAGVRGAAHRAAPAGVRRVRGRSVSCSTRRRAASSCACRSKRRAVVACSTRRVRKIAVPDLTSPEAVISTPRVHRARTARELQTVAADAAAVPVAGREFSRTERLLIRFDVYGGGTPSAVLMNRTGQKMADLPVTPAKVGGTHQIDMGLNAVAAGEYLVEITVKGATTESKELLAVRVTS